MAVLKASQITDKEKLYYLASRARRSSVNSFFLNLLLSRAVQNGKDYAWLRTSNSKFDDYKRVSGIAPQTVCKQHIEDKEYEKLLRDFLTILQTQKTNDYIDILINTLDEYCTGDSASAVPQCINFGVGKLDGRENTFDEEAIEKVAKRLNFAPIVKALTKEENGSLTLKEEDEVDEKYFNEQLDTIINDLESLPNIFKNCAEKTIIK